MAMLAGRYELGPRIERGGMATVYRATDTVLHRPVAVKVLAGTFARDGAFVERFEREGRNAARLSHPNVVRVFDAGSDGGTHFIVMELVEGTTLARLIADRAPLEPDRAARIAGDVAAALAAAHAEGIVHRDVKPANVLIAANGAVKVADFGIARAADAASITQTGALLGTAAYVSPEQAAGMPATPRSDINALGCVLYEMLTGRPPFLAEAPIATLQRHLNEPVVPPSSVVPVPPSLDRLVVACLAKDPSERPASAADIRRELQMPTAAEGHDDTIAMPAAGNASATRASAPASALASAPAGRWWSRPGSLVLGALALVAVLIAVVVAMVGRGPGSAERTGGRDPATGAAEADPSASSPARSPTPSPPVSVDAAYTLLLAGIEDQVQLGGIEDEAAEDLRHRAEDVGKELDEGAYDEAAIEIAAFTERLREAVGEGEVSAASAEVITERMRILVQAVIAELGGLPERPAEEGSDDT